MPTITLKIALTPDVSFSKELVSDTTDYTGNTVTAATVDVYLPNSTVPVTLDLISYYTAPADPTKIDYNITPTDLSLTTDYLPDGEIRFVFNLAVTVGSTPSTGLLNYNELIFGQSLAYLQRRIGEKASYLYKDNCNCDKEQMGLETDMYMQLQSAIFSHGQKDYISAQQKINEILGYCTSNIDNCVDC